MLLFAVGFNLWLYRLEPSAQVDPNDNLFQFALVYRTNQIWDFADKICSGNMLTYPLCHFSYLADHWVPNWNEGYNLPFYYSHIPQIAIVGSYRLVSGITCQVSKLVPLMTHDTCNITLFSYYHLVIYLLLSLFPITMFFALLVVGVSPITAGFGALLAAQISTDGLYGLDPPSFLWRGYGLSSQLFAMVWLPLAVAYAWRYFESKQSMKGAIKFSKDASELRFRENFHRDRNFLWPAVLFLILTTSGHIGVGIMAFLSLIPLAYGGVIVTFLYCYIAQDITGKSQQQFNNATLKQFRNNTIKLFILSATSIFILSYWLVPAFLGDKFHNFSFWDPVWKFNSYGAKETLSRLGNGDLFDFGRLPVYTALVIVGVFAVLRKKYHVSGVRKEDGQINNRTMQQYNNENDSDEDRLNSHPYFPFAVLFIFWLLLYFGRTTWGNLINFIPTMKEFHLSRFIVGVHLAGLFLAPIGLTWIALKIKITMQQFNNKTISSGLLYCCIVLLLTIGIWLTIYPQTISYNQLNETLIKRANGNYARQSPDMNLLVTALQDLEKTNPGRVHAGRGGQWGHDFKIAETNMTMYLGNFALSTVLWLPETWSPNGDTEQYFREDKQSDYDLFNIRYVATPKAIAKENVQPFWHLIKTNPSWNLYEIDTSGYFTAGVVPAIVSADKYSRANAVRLWIQSDDPKNGLYPQLTFDTKNYPVNTGLPNFKMLDEVTFQVPDGSMHNVFAEPPKYVAPSPTLPISLTHQTDDTDMIFSAKATVPAHCTDCLVILKQTYSPDWQITDNGLAVTPIIVFPFYIGIPVSAGAHSIVVSYQPSKMKIFLLIFTGIITIVSLIFLLKRNKKKLN